MPYGLDYPFSVTGGSTYEKCIFLCSVLLLAGFKEYVILLPDLFRCLFVLFELGKIILYIYFITVSQL